MLQTLAPISSPLLLRPLRVPEVEEGPPGHFRVVEHTVQDLQFRDALAPR